MTERFIAKRVREIQLREIQHGGAPSVASFIREEYRAARRAYTARCTDYVFTDDAALADSIATQTLAGRFRRPAIQQ